MSDSYSTMSLDQIRARALADASEMRFCADSLGTHPAEPAGERAAVIDTAEDFLTVDAAYVNQPQVVSAILGVIAARRGSGGLRDALLREHVDVASHSDDVIGDDEVYHGTYIQAAEIVLRDGLARLFDFFTVEERADLTLQ